MVEWRIRSAMRTSCKTTIEEIEEKKTILVQALSGIKKWSNLFRWTTLR